MAQYNSSQQDVSVPEWLRKKVLVLGCGNRLFGDDGFGPTVIEELLRNYELPEDVCALDVGTGVRKILFTVVLSETKPSQIIIVDALDAGRPPGELFELEVDDLPENKVDDFSMHQLPTSNLLKELKRLGAIEVCVLGCQSAFIPEEVSLGFSPAVKASIPAMCALIMNRLKPATPVQA
ncbi:MAG: hydrogenase maturation protease [Lentisphaerae bacterium]|nr:hydrogenase maturation protease [Lentisphaerota bacterium]